MRHLFLILVLTFFMACQSNPKTEKLKHQNQTLMQGTTGNKAQVRAFFQYLEDKDIPAMVDLFSDNGEQINPYASGLFPNGAKGKKALMNYWEPVPQNFDGMEFTIEELLETENTNLIYVKYRGKIQLKNDAGFYENQYYSTFRFNNDGKITEYVEIFNPIVAAKAFGLIDSIN